MKLAKRLMGPNGGDPHWQYVELYLPMTGANNGTTFTDVAKGRTVTRNAPLLTVVGTGPQGDNSFGYFTSVNDVSLRQLSVPHATALSLTNKDFCIDWFFRPTSEAVNGTSPLFFGKRGTGASQLEIQMDIWNGKLNLYVSSNGTSWTALFEGLTWAKVYNQWYHMRLSRCGPTWRVWIGGTKVWQGTYSGTLFSGSEAFGVMGSGTSAQRGTWSMSHFRLTVGHARETTDVISVPMLPYPTI